MVHNQLPLHGRLHVALDLVNQGVQLVVEVSWLPDEVDLLFTVLKGHLILGYFLPLDFAVSRAADHRIPNDLGSIPWEDSVVERGRLLGLRFRLVDVSGRLNLSPCSLSFTPILRGFILLLAAY